MCKAPGGFNKPETRPPSSVNSQGSSECPGLMELSWNDLIFFHLCLWNKSLASLYPDLWSCLAFAGSFSVTNSVISEVKMPRPVYWNKLKTGFSSLSAWPVWGLEACGTGGGRLLCASFLARFLFLFCTHQSPFVTPPRLSSDREEMRGKAERIWRVTDGSRCGKCTKVTFSSRGVFSGRFLGMCSHGILMSDCSIFPSCDAVPILTLPGVTLGQVLCSVGWGSWLPPPTWSISGSWEASCVHHRYWYSLLTLHIRLPERHSGFSSLILNFSRRGLCTTALCSGGPHFKLPEGNSVLRDNQQLCFSSSGCTSFSTGRMEIPENSTNSLYWKLPLRWMMAIVCYPFQTLLSFPVLIVQRTL